MVTNNLILLALTASLVSAETGIHSGSSMPSGGVYNKADNCLTGKKCITSSNEGAGFLGVGWIILIVTVISLPLLGIIVYCCCCKKKTKDINKDVH